MSDRRILHLVNRLDQASAKYDQASATYRATRDLRWQAAVSEAAREKQAAARIRCVRWTATTSWPRPMASWPPPGVRSKHDPYQAARELC